MTSSFLSKILILTLPLFISTNACALVTIQVNSSADEPDDDVTDGVCHTQSGNCTLRAAAMTANRELFDTQIDLPSGVYTLSIKSGGSASEYDGAVKLVAPPQSSNAQIFIVGAGRDLSVVDGGGISRVFEIASGRDAYFRALTIRDGKEPTANGAGGISNSGRLTLYDVAVTANESQVGAGIVNFGNLTITSSAIENNVASAVAGAIENLGPLQVNYSVISGNISGIVAGGVENENSATFLAFQSTFEANTAQTDGGAIRNIGDASLSIYDCTFSHNSAGDGGAIEGWGNLTMVNSTLAENTASNNGGGLHRKVSSSGAWNIYNSTIAYNEADSADQNGSGGGIYVLRESGVAGTLNIYNTLVAGNIVGHLQQADDCNGNGTLDTHANNLFGSTAGCPITQVSGSYGQLNSLSYLGLLADNGGTTKTVALLPGSSAIDAGYSGGCFDNFSDLIVSDQRGDSRPVGAACDVGAYEYRDVIFKNGFE